MHPEPSCTPVYPMHPDAPCSVHAEQGKTGHVRQSMSSTADPSVPWMWWEKVQLSHPQEKQVTLQSQQFTLDAVVPAVLKTAAISSVGCSHEALVVGTVKGEALACMCVKGGAFMERLTCSSHHGAGRGLDLCSAGKGGGFKGHARGQVGWHEEAHKPEVAILANRWGTVWL